MIETESYYTEALERVWSVRDADGVVDHYRTESAARYAARTLNIGASEISPHRPIGCRVEPGRVQPLRRREDVSGEGT